MVAKDSQDSQGPQDPPEETPEGVEDWLTSLLVLLALAEEGGPEEVRRVLRELERRTTAAKLNKDKPDPSED